MRGCLIGMQRGEERYSIRMQVTAAFFPFLPSSGGKQTAARTRKRSNDRLHKDPLFISKMPLQHHWRARCILFEYVLWVVQSPDHPFPPRAQRFHQKHGDLKFDALLHLEGRCIRRIYAFSQWSCWLFVFADNWNFWCGHSSVGRICGRRRVWREHFLRCKFYVRSKCLFILVDWRTIIFRFFSHGKISLFVFRTSLYLPYMLLVRAHAGASMRTRTAFVRRWCSPYYCCGQQNGFCEIFAGSLQLCGWKSCQFTEKHWISRLLSSRAKILPHHRDEVRRREWGDVCSRQWMERIEPRHIVGVAWLVRRSHTVTGSGGGVWRCHPPTSRKKAASTWAAVVHADTGHFQVENRAGSAGGESGNRWITNWRWIDNLSFRNSRARGVHPSEPSVWDALASYFATFSPTCLNSLPFSPEMSIAQDHWLISECVFAVWMNLRLRVPFVGDRWWWYANMRSRRSTSQSSCSGRQEWSRRRKRVSSIGFQCAHCYSKPFWTSMCIQWYQRVYHYDTWVRFIAGMLRSWTFILPICPASEFLKSPVC